MQRVPEESILPLAEDSHRPWYLLGIVSFGTCGASNPGMFTRLRIYFILKCFENQTIILHIHFFQNGEFCTMDTREYKRLNAHHFFYFISFIVIKMFATDLKKRWSEGQDVQRVDGRHYCVQGVKLVFLRFFLLFNRFPQF